MKFKSLLLLIGTVSSVAYANIPEGAPYKSIIAINYTQDALVAMGSNGVAYITHNGQSWENLFSFSSTKSGPYYAYEDKLGNGYFMNGTGTESWKYDAENGSVSPDGNIFTNLGRGRLIKFIGSSYDNNHTQYALTTNGTGGFFSADIYSRSDTQQSWVKLSTGPSNYSEKFIAIGSQSGDYMVLDKNNSMLYNVSGTINYQPLPCNNVNPSFLGVVPAVGDEFTDTYYLMCGMGNKARLYWNDDPRSGNGWSSIGELFAPSAEDSSSYSYVMAKLPTYLNSKLKLPGKSTVFKNPTLFMIVENHKSGPDFGRLCLRSNRTKNNETECGSDFPIPKNGSGSQVYSGSIFRDSEGHMRAVFVGSSQFVLDIPIDIQPEGNTRVIYALPAVWE